MLHSKSQIQLQNATIREYKDSDFGALFNMSWNLQQKIQVFYLNSMKIANPMWKIREFDQNLRKLLKNNKHKYIAIDTDRQRIFGFSAFNPQPNSKIMILNFCCKDAEYVFDRKAKEVFFDSLKLFPDNTFRVFLGKRGEYDKYVRFMMRVFPHEYVGEDGLGRKILDLRLT
jgi:hypothetical protein